MDEQADKNGQPEPRKKRPFYKRWWFWSVVAFIAAFVICIGPWPAYYESYEGTDYANATFERLADLDLKPTEGPLSAGTARVEITPNIGEPLAGFSGRDPNTCDGVIDRLYARAITLSNGMKTVTIVGGDILLIMPQLRDAILERTGLPREDVYFTATHTHCGPGGYSSRWVDQIVTGRYDEAVFSRLTDAFVAAIMASRKNMTKATLASTDICGKGGQVAVNRIDKQSPAHEHVWSMIFTPPLIAGESQPVVATLVIASPHPTCMGSSCLKACGDYPGVAESKIEADLGGICLFAIGAAGSMGPVKDTPHGIERVRTNGTRIAGLATMWYRYLVNIIAGPEETADMMLTDGQPLQAALDAMFNPNVKLSSAILEVDLPPVQYRLGDYLRLSPVAGRYLHSRRSYIHILRINDQVLLGMPADYSGELALELEKWAAERKSTINPVITSFNGDYIGYLIPECRYHLNDYESRDINSFGPYCGDYFNALAQKTLEYICRSDQAAVKKK